MTTKFGTSLIKGKDSFKVGQEAAMKAMKRAGIKKVDLSVVFASSKYDYKSVVKGVNSITNNAPLIGCSSSGEFTEEKIDKESVVCAVISSDTHKFFPGIGKGLKEDENKALRKASSKFPSVVKGHPYRSAILLIDGLAGKGEEAVLGAVEILGPNVKFSGGSAADDLKFKETKVFTNNEVLSNAVSLTLIASRIPVMIGVKHGHSPISPPLTITKVKGNIVYEIDNKPAFSVWKKYTRENAKNIGIDVDKMSKAEAIKMFFTQY